MEKKTINKKTPSFEQAYEIAESWCKDWEDDLLSEEVLADRVSELIKTKFGIRGFFAYSLSDKDCSLLDKLPFPLIFKFTEIGNKVVEITVSNLIMSSAQVISHEKENNHAFKLNSENISERCKGLLRVLDTKLVTENINKMLDKLDDLGNSFDKSKKYDYDQKEFIKKQILDIAQ